MNKSYSKIRHIQKMNVLLEQKYLNEQTTPINNQEEANNFKNWLFSTYPLLTQAGVLNLDKNKTYSYNDPVLINAWNYTIGRGGISDKLGNWYTNDSVNKKYNALWKGGQNTPTSPSVQRTVSSSTNVIQPSRTGIILNPPYNTKEYTDLVVNLEETLKIGKTWWKDYLNNENTLAKFIKLNNLTTYSAKKYYEKYFSVIDNLKISYYSKNTAPNEIVMGAYAYIECSNMSTINVNLDLIIQKTPKQRIDTIIHETQHLLFCVFPMTPGKNVTEFKASDDCYAQNKAIYDNTDITKENRLKALIINNEDKIANDLGVSSEEVLNKIQPFIDTAYSGFKKDYILGNPSELLSRLAATRNYFNKNILTKEDFVNYILNYKQKTSNGNVDYIIGHWILNEFKRSLGDFVTYLNTEFVKTDGTKQRTSPTDLPYKSKEGLV